MSNKWLALLIMLWAIWVWWLIILLIIYAPVLMLIICIASVLGWLYYWIQEKLEEFK